MNNLAFERAVEAHREERYREANALIIECLESASNIRDGECLANGLLLFADNLLCYCPEGDDPFEGRRVAAQEALRLFRDLGDRRGEARSLLILASVDVDLDLGEESLKVAREIGDKPLMADAMSWIGNSLYMSGKKQEGVSAASEAVQLARECNDPELLLQTLFTLGLLADDVPVRIAAFEEMASVVPERRGGFGRRLNPAASLLLDDGELELAERLWQVSLSIARDRGDAGAEGSVLLGLASLARKRGDEAKADELEAMGKVLIGPVPDLTEFGKAAESGDGRSALAALKAALGGR
jgi:tetratricopeptide (TPR) repeat protein